MTGSSSATDCHGVTSTNQHQSDFAIATACFLSWTYEVV